MTIVKRAGIHENQHGRWLPTIIAFVWAGGVWIVNNTTFPLHNVLDEFIAMECGAIIDDVEEASLAPAVGTGR